MNTCHGILLHMCTAFCYICVLIPHTAQGLQSAICVLILRRDCLKGYICVLIRRRDGVKRYQESQTLIIFSNILLYSTQVYYVCVLLLILRSLLYMCPHITTGLSGEPGTNQQMARQRSLSICGDPPFRRFFFLRVPLLILLHIIHIYVYVFSY